MRITNQWVSTFSKELSPSEFAIGHIMRATTHFESCVWHLDRFIKHARALRGQKNAESELKALIPKDLSFFAGSAHAITDVRNMISHLVEEARDGKLPQGAKIVLALLKDGLSIIFPRNLVATTC